MMLHYRFGLRLARLIMAARLMDEQLIGSERAQHRAKTRFISRHLRLILVRVANSASYHLPRRPIDDLQPAVRCCICKPYSISIFL